MNRFYRHIWSEPLRSWIVVPETAKRSRKSSGAPRAMQAVVGALASFALSGISSLIYAQQAPPANQLPVFGSVVRGAATVSQSVTPQSATLQVQQSTPKAVIDWKSFNVGQQGTVNFQQPDKSSVTLNQISDQNASQIQGQIKANGQVFLSNPNGVYFSPTSRVDVGGLVATTQKIAPDDFMEGRMRFEQGSKAASVVNEGVLNAGLGGYIALLAPEVQNLGVIVAKQGTVALAAGDVITLKFDGSGSLAGLTTTPSTLGALIENKYAIEAPDGHIILSAIALDHLQAGLVRNSGHIEASSLTQVGGKIILEANEIELMGGSIAASGRTGGGTVLIGSDWEGKGELRQASKITMQPSVKISANATEQGDGGTVVVRSRPEEPGSQAILAGHIEALGGPAGGHGGRVETSAGHLSVEGLTVSTAAPNGQKGEWLLDPYDVYIDGTATDMTAASGVYTGSSQPSHFNATDLASALTNNNVTISTLGSGAGDGDIFVNASIAASPATTSSLNLNASRDIVIADGVSIAATTGILNLTLNSNAATPSTGGAVLIRNNVTINTNGGDIKIGGGSAGVAANYAVGAQTTNQLNGNAVGVRIGNVSDVVTDANVRISSGGGNISIKGQGGDFANIANTSGIFFSNGSVIDSGTGSISIMGVGGAQTNGAANGLDFVPATHGIKITSAKTAGAAAISLTGTASVAGSAGIMSWYGSNKSIVSATGGGDIVVTGNSTSTHATSYGIGLNNMDIVATGGSITVDAGAQGFKVLDSNDGAGPVNIGSSAKVGSIAASTANVLLTANRYYFGSDGFSIKTSGEVELTSTASSFSSDLSLLNGAFALLGTPSKLSIGKSTNTSNIFLTSALNVGGKTNINAGTLNLGADITTGNDFIINSNVNLTSNVTLNSAASISFKGTVDGAYSLSPTVGSNGILVFNNNVGSTTPLTSITTGSNGLTYINGNITSSGGLSFNNDVLVGIIGSPPFNNGSFESSAAGAITTVSGLSGWSVYNQSVRLGVDSIGGFLSPVDTTRPPTAASGCTISCDFPGSGFSFTSTIVTDVASGADGTKSIKLFSQGSSPGFGIVRGPYIVSNGAVALGNGDQVTFKWKAMGGSDAGDVYGYLLNTANGNTVKLLDVTTASAGDSTYNTWRTNVTTVSTAGNYKFVFLSGSWDATGGSALGAQLFVDSVGTVTNPTNLALFNTTTCSVCVVTGTGTVAGSGINFAKNVTIGSTQLKINNAYASSITGEMSGLGAFYKDGLGTLTLGSVNSYGGTTTVHAGTLKNAIAEAVPDGSAVIVDTGATWDLNNLNDKVGSISGTGSIQLGTAILTSGADNTNTTFSGDISGTGEFKKSGTGTLTMSTPNTYSGSTEVIAGVLSISDVAALGSVTSEGKVSTGGTLDINAITGLAKPVTLAGGTLKSSTGNSSVNANIALTANSTIDVSGIEMSIAGVISGASFGITKTGTGTLTLVTPATYTGPTVINAGTLSTGADQVIADTSAVTVAAGATLNLTNRTETVGSLAGAGSVNIQAASLTTGADNSTDKTFSGVLSGTGALTVAGTGKQTLSGTNTYTGQTTISSGTLALSGSGSIATSSGVATGGTLDIAATTSGATVKTISGSGGVTLGTKDLTLSQASTSYGGTIAGTGGLTVATGGNLTITGHNTFSGDTVIPAGATVTVTGTGDLSGSGVKNAGTFDISGVTSGTSVRFLSGAGTFNRNGKLMDRTGVNFSNVNLNDLNDWLSFGNVTLQAVAAQDVTLSTAATVDTPVAGTGNIYVNTPVSLNDPGNFKLGFNAATQVQVNNNIDVLNGGGLVFTNKNDALSLPNNSKINLTGVGASLNIGGSNYSFVNSVADFVNMTANGNYALTSDIDLSATTYNSAVFTTTFTGNFDGLGRKFTGLKINNSGGGIQNLGLFAELRGAGVRNLGIENVLINTSSTSAGATGTEYRIGALAGNVGNAALTSGYAANAYTTTIDGVWSSGSIYTANNFGVDSATSGDRQKFFFAGGLLGSHNNGTLTMSRSYSNATVSSYGSYADNIALGGLIGDVGFNRVLSGAGATVGTPTQLQINLSKVFTSGSVVSGDHGNYHGSGGIVGVIFTTGTTISDIFSWGNAVPGPVSWGGVFGYSAGGSVNSAYTTQSTLTAGTVTGTARYISVQDTPGTTLPTGFNSNIWVKVDGKKPYLKDLPVPATPLYVQYGTGATSQYGEALAPISYSIVDSAGTAVSLNALGLGAIGGTAISTLSASANAGTYAVSYLGGFSLTGANASSYFLNPSTTAGSYTITPRVLSITGTTVADKVYNATTAATPTLGTLSGFYSTETVTATATAVFDSANVGARIGTVTYTLVDGTNGGRATNYSLAPTAGLAANITPAVLQLSGSKVYDGTSTVAGATLTGTGVGGQLFAINGNGDISNLLSKNVQSNALLNSLTGLTIGNSSNGGSASNYTLNVAQTSFSITPRPAIAVSKVYDGSTALPASAVTTNILAGDTVTVNLSGLSGSFDNKNVGNTHTVSVSGVTFSGADAANYAAPATLNGVITRLSSVNWIGGATGNWLNPSNWFGGAVPDLANVANVNIPAGTTVTFNNQATPPASQGTVSVESVNGGATTSTGAVNLSAGTLQVGTGGAKLAGLNYSGGNLNVGGNLTVSDSFAQTASSALVVGGNAQITNTQGALALGNMAVTGGLSVTNTDGAITQAAGSSLQVTGSSAMTASQAGVAAAITLDKNTNQLTGPVSASGSNVTLNNASNLVLGAIRGTGDLAVTSGGNVTQQDSAVVAGNTTVASTNATATVSMTNAGNSFTGPVSATAQDVAIASAQALQLGNLTVGRNLAVTSQGDITQTAALQVPGTANLDAGSGNIQLLTAQNDFVGAVSLKGKDVAVTDANQLQLGAVTASGNANVITAGALDFGATKVQGNLSAVSGNGNISQSQPISVNGTVTLDAGTGQIDLSQPGNVLSGTPVMTAAAKAFVFSIPVVAVYVPPVVAKPEPPVAPPPPVVTSVTPEQVKQAASQAVVSALGQSTTANKAVVTSVNNTSPAATPLLNDAQMGSIGAASLAGMSNVQLLALSPAQVSTLAPSAVANLSNQQIAVLSQSSPLSAAQLGSLSSTQISAVAPAQFANFSGAEISGFSTSQVAAVTPSQIAAVQPAEVRQIAVSTVSAMSTTQISALTAVSGLAVPQLNALSNEQIAAVSPQQFTQLTAAQFSTLGETQMKALTPTQVAAIPPSALGAIAPEQMASLGNNLVATLSTAQFVNLSGGQISSLSPEQISSVSPVQLSQLNSAQVSALTNEQISAMSPLQQLALAPTPEIKVPELTLVEVSALTVRQLENLSMNQLQSMNGLQVRALQNEQIQALTPTQVSSLAPVQIQALTTEQLSSMSLVQAVSLSESQLAVMSAVQRSAIPQGGVLPVAILGSNNASPMGIEFEARPGSISVNVTSAAPAMSSPPSGIDTTQNLQTFTVVGKDGVAVEFKGAVTADNKLLIVAPNDNARNLVQSDLTAVVEPAFTALGAAQKLELPTLTGLVLDIR